MSAHNIKSEENDNVASTSKSKLNGARKLKWTANSEKETFRTIVTNYKLCQDNCCRQSDGHRRRASIKRLEAKSKRQRSTWKQDLAKVHSNHTNIASDCSSKIDEDDTSFELELSKLYDESLQELRDTIIEEKPEDEEEQIIPETKVHKTIWRARENKLEEIKEEELALEESEIKEAQTPSQEMLINEVKIPSGEIHIEVDKTKVEEIPSGSKVTKLPSMDKQTQVENITIEKTPLKKRLIKATKIPCSKSFIKVHKSKVSEIPCEEKEIKVRKISSKDKQTQVENITVEKISPVEEIAEVTKIPSWQLDSKVDKIKVEQMPCQEKEFKVSQMPSREKDIQLKEKAFQEKENSVKDIKVTDITLVEREIKVLEIPSSESKIKVTETKVHKIPSLKSQIKVDEIKVKEIASKEKERQIEHVSLVLPTVNYAELEVIVISDDETDCKSQNKETPMLTNAGSLRKLEVPTTSKATLTSHHLINDHIFPIDSMENIGEKLKSKVTLPTERIFETESSSTELLKVKTPTSTFKQRQLELHRHRVAVEEKRIEVLGVKLARERDEMVHEQILFEKELELKSWQLRQLKETIGSKFK